MILVAEVNRRSLGNIMAEARCERSCIVGINLRVVRPAHRKSNSPILRLLCGCLLLLAGISVRQASGATFNYWDGPPPLANQSWDRRGARRRRLTELQTIGIDLGKTVFHVVGRNARREVVVRK